MRPPDLPIVVGSVLVATTIFATITVAIFFMVSGTVSAHGEQSVRSELLKETEGLSQAQADWRPAAPTVRACYPRSITVQPRLTLTLRVTPTCITKAPAWRRRMSPASPR